MSYTYKLLRTDSGNRDFQKLVEALDKYLAICDGDEHSFFAQYNKIDLIRHVVVAYEGGTPLGCGAIKPYGEGVMEVKRMYVTPENRGRGIASLILGELESWARELGYNKCILETGIKQPEAISLYRKSGYNVTPNYGQYAGVEISVCFEKILD